MPIPADRLGQPDLSEVDVNKIVSYLRPDIEPEDSVESDALIFDAESTPNTMRYMEI